MPYHRQTSPQVVGSNKNPNQKKPQPKKTPKTHNSRPTHSNIIMSRSVSPSTINNGEASTTRINRAKGKKSPSPNYRQVQEPLIYKIGGKLVEIRPGKRDPTDQVALGQCSDAMKAKYMMEDIGGSSEGDRIAGLKNLEKYKKDHGSISRGRKEMPRDSERMKYDRNFYNNYLVDDQGRGHGGKGERFSLKSGASGGGRRSSKGRPGEGINLQEQRIKKNIFKQISRETLSIDGNGRSSDGHKYGGG